ncbi:MAG: hypothetical protein PHP12_02385 [Bacilli bacterium]|nr:hypothetical protein [Bacilli bacterium]
MNIEKLMEEYVNELATDETKTGGIELILVSMTKEGEFNHSIGNDLNVLIDNYDDEDITPEEALKLELIELGSKIGAIYKRNGEQFELLVKVER